MSFLSCGYEHTIRIDDGLIIITSSTDKKKMEMVFGKNCEITANKHKLTVFDECLWLFTKYGWREIN